MSESATTPSSYRIKIFADAAFLRELKADQVSITIESEREEKDATQLGFQVEAVIAVVVTVQAVLDSAKLAAKIYRWWHRSKSQVVVLQTPFGSLTMRKSGDITKADVKKFLAATSKIYR